MAIKKNAVRFEKVQENESPADSAEEYEDEGLDEEEDIEDDGSDDEDDEDIEGDSSEEDEEEEGEQANLNEDVVDDLTYDLANFTACHYHPLVWAGEDKEAVILEAATRACQLMYKKLMDLPTETSDTGPLCILPTKEVFSLPRTRKVPEPKPETRWESFARERGIKKHKKERMVYDETAEEFKPRFGYKRAKAGVEDLAIVEVADGADPTADPWAAARKDKKDRVKHNLKNQMRNMMKAERTAKGGKKGYDPESVPGIPIEFNASAGKRGKAGVRKALQLAQHSTASMGRFDEMREGEPERKMSGKKRSFRDNLSAVGSEKTVMKSQLRIVEDKISKKARGVTNSLAAYEGILPDAPGLAFKKGKGRGKNAGDKPKGKGKGKRH